MTHVVFRRFYYDDHEDRLVAPPQLGEYRSGRVHWRWQSDVSYT